MGNVECVPEEACETSGCTSFINLGLHHFWKCDPNACLDWTAQVEVRPHGHVCLSHVHRGGFRVNIQGQTGNHWYFAFLNPVTSPPILFWCNQFPFSCSANSSRLLSSRITPQSSTPVTPLSWRSHVVDMLPMKLLLPLNKMIVVKPASLHSAASSEYFIILRSWADCTPSPKDSELDPNTNVYLARVMWSSLRGTTVIAGVLFCALCNERYWILNTLGEKCCLFSFLKFSLKAYYIKRTQAYSNSMLGQVCPNYLLEHRENLKIKQTI